MPITIIDAKMPVNNLGTLIGEQLRCLLVVVHEICMWYGTIVS